MKQHHIRFYIGLLISVLFLYFAFRGMDWISALYALKHTRYEYVLPALGVYLLALWIRAYRWTFLLPPGIKMSTKKLFPIFILGCFANNILPLRLGDVYRAYILGKKENIRKSKALASIFIDKVFDALAVLTILGVAAWVLSSRFPDWERQLLKISSIVLFSGVIGVWFILWNRRFANRLIEFMITFLPLRFQNKISGMIHNFLDGMNTLRDHKIVVIAFSLSLLSWLIEAIMYYLFALALDPQFPIYAAPVILAVVNLGMMIPSSPGGVGPFEFFCIKTSAPFFQIKSTAMTYSVLIHLGWFLPITAMGIYYLWKEELSLKNFSEDSNDSA